MKSSSPESPATWHPADFDGSAAAAAAPVGPSPWNPAEFAGPAGVDPVDAPPWHAPGPAPPPEARPGDPPPTREDVEEAHARGFAEGRAAGAREAMEELRPALGALQGMVESIQSVRAQMLQDVESNLCLLALAAARNIVQREIEADPTLLRELVVRGLAAVKPDSPIEVRLHPDDLEALRPLLEDAGHTTDAEVRWTGDPGLQRGGFFLAGPQRLVDGRLDEALRHLYQRMIYE